MGFATLIAVVLRPYLAANNLAMVYYYQGKYKQTEPLWVRALAIKEQELGESHPDTAILAMLLAA